MRKTKIVCTIGPASDSEDLLRQLMLAGMDVARLNFSHASHVEHLRHLNMLRKVAAALNKKLPVMLDTKGPEIRLGTFKDKSVEIEQGDEFILTTEDIEGDNRRVSISFKGLPGDVHKGIHILIADGLIELEVQRTSQTEVFCTVLNGGPLSDNKNVNIPGVHISLPFISEKDKDDLLFGAEHHFDLLAASFTRCADDIRQIRAILGEHGGEQIKIIAKIENDEGVANADEILQVADGIMVARGDMGVNIPIEEIPSIQKNLIRKAYDAGKIVVTATQMLDSMIHNPRPTRAEATDVSNAVYDGTSAVMLSGETAAGSYPVEAVRMMEKIVAYTESGIDYKEVFAKRDLGKVSDVSNAIAHATCITAHDIDAVAIIAITKSGSTANLISKFRPACPIIACTTDETVCRQLAISWGVFPLMITEADSTDHLFYISVRQAVEAGLLKKGDIVVIAAGVTLGISGTTNLIKVQIIGDISVAQTGAAPSAFAVVDS